VRALLDEPPPGFRIEPVQLTETGGRWLYRHAHRFTLELLGCDPTVLAEEAVDLHCGDLLLGLDLSGDLLVRAERSGLFADLQRRGVGVYSVVFDLLPVRLPEVFPPGADRAHAQWLEAVSRFDGAVCISRAVADDLARWRADSGLQGEDRGHFRIGWFHLGADFTDSGDDRAIPDHADATLAQLRARPGFLMVGTIEPRKGYLQTIEAFSRLWEQGVDVNLVIVGKEGWTHLPLSMRRDIPATMERLRNHPELNKRLFWLEGISDAHLAKVYAAGTCLIAASYGEGFGLPLIEAARHGLPVMARDIPVFREVAGEGAHYFQARDDRQMAAAVKAWLDLRERREAPSSGGIPFWRWQQSARAVAAFCLGEPR
jgi:glycosyltransferase involved in cell wall biosynthesis